MTVLHTVNYCAMRDFEAGIGDRLPAEALFEDEQYIFMAAFDSPNPEFDAARIPVRLAVNKENSGLHKVIFDLLQSDMEVIDVVEARLFSGYIRNPSRPLVSANYDPMTHGYFLSHGPGIRDMQLEDAADHQAARELVAA